MDKIQNTGLKRLIGLATIVAAITTTGSKNKGLYTPKPKYLFTASVKHSSTMSIINPETFPTLINDIKPPSSKFVFICSYSSFVIYHF